MKVRSAKELFFAITEIKVDKTSIELTKSGSYAQIQHLESHLDGAQIMSDQKTTHKIILHDFHFKVAFCLMIDELI